MSNKLTGSSGVSIFFKRIHGLKIVRKQTVEKEQIERLKIQFEKHGFLLKHQYKFFNTPEILNHGFDKAGLFFYEYRYIEGVNMTQSFMEKSTKQLLPIMDDLLFTIKFFRGQKNFYEKTYTNKTFKQMLHEKVDRNSSYLDLKLRKKMLGTLENLNLPSNKTLHHGDLTFENIIIDKKKKIWLIDPIGTFYPHYFLDISTLFQDIEGEWSKIKHGITFDKEKSKYFTNYLKQNISYLDKKYLKIHNFLMAVKFLRILPYLKNKSKMEKVLKKIQFYLDVYSEG